MRQLFLIVIMGIIIFVSCDKKPHENEREISSWHTMQQDFSLTVDEVIPYEFTEKIKNERECDASVAVSEAESYRMTLKRDGTGYGSGIRRDNNGRYDFRFTWQITDGWLNIKESESGNGVFFTYDWVALEFVDWKIEESTADKMVLVFSLSSNVQALDGSSWRESYTYRYTFVKDR